MIITNRFFFTMSSKEQHVFNRYQLFSSAYLYVMFPFD